MIAAVKTRSEEKVNVTSPLTELPVWSKLTNDVIREAQRNDAVIAPVVAFKLNQKTMPSDDEVKYCSSETQQLCYLWNSLILINGLLYRIFVRPDGKILKYQHVVPESLRMDVIASFHHSNTSCHRGSKKVFEAICRVAYWPGMRGHIDKVVRQCAVCARACRWPTAKQGKLQSWPASRPFQRVHIDLSGEYNRTARGNVYILSVIDFFTKYLITVPLRDKSALTVAQALVKNVYLVHGACELQLSDNGLEFKNQVSLNICRLLQIPNLNSVPWRPNCIAAVERVHHSLHNMFRKMIDGNFTS
jgi:hypothetical protein